MSFNFNIMNLYAKGEMTYKLESTHLKDDIVIEICRVCFQDSYGSRRGGKASTTVRQSQQRL